MSIENEMRRTRKTNLEFRGNRLRLEIESLTRIVRINLDCSLNKPEALPVEEIDGQWDVIKAKWAELNVALAEIQRLDEELA